jgi:DNA-binding NtrC family response regulator
MRRPAQVLLIEDREIVRLTVRDIVLDFASALHFECLVVDAPDGATALALIAENFYDVIFLDLMLPDLSGIEIMRRAKAAQLTLGKVIILTGLPDPRSEEEARELGAIAYLKKSPLDYREITNALSSAISDVVSTFSSAPRPGPSGQRDVGVEPKVMTPRRGKIQDRRPRLLILDDKQPWLDTISQVLGQEFNLTMTTSHEEACRRVEKGGFALVVLDMILGGDVNGLDVLTRMRKAAPNLRAIILTGKPDYKSAVEGGRRGALDYVSKGELTLLRDTVARGLADQATAARIFLSYEKSDRAKVSRVFDRLMAEGFLPWMDVKSILGGEWEPAIQKAIAEADYFLFFLSSHSVNKEGVIRREVKQALKRQDGLRDGSIFFVTARLDDSEVAPPFDRFQYFDLFKRDGFSRLLRSFGSR